MILHLLALSCLLEDILVANLKVLFSKRLPEGPRSASLTRMSAARGHRFCIEGHWAVFVFTLDCNNRVYCYNTEDAHASSRLADKNKLAEVLWTSRRLRLTSEGVQCDIQAAHEQWVLDSPVKVSNVISKLLMSNGCLSTVLAQDHFYSDFLISQTTVSTNFNHLDDESKRPLDRNECPRLWRATLVTQMFSMGVKLRGWL